MAAEPQRVTWPPRLTGVLFEGERPFDGAAYLSLDNLTVLLGANGAGKTTTLRLLEENLPSLVAPVPAPKRSAELDRTACSFYVELTEDQLAVLLSELGTEEAATADADAAIVDAAIDRLKGDPSIDLSEEAWSRLRTSRIVRVDHTERPGWVSVSWCVAHAETTAAADAVGGSDDAARSAPETLVSLGITNRTMLPVAVAVPRELADIRLELRDAIIDVLVHLRWAERDRWSHLRGVPVTDAEDRRGTKAWLKDPDADVVAISPDARALCNLASALSTSVVPEFVSDTHRLDVSIEPIYRWEQGGPALALDLVRRGGLRYPMSGAADGHKVWLQFAMLEAVAIIRRYLVILEGLLELAEKPRESTDSAARSRWRRYDAAVELLRSFEHPADTPTSLDQFTALRNVGHRLYLIDEPEQHLHPRLQRSAASWLVDAGTAGASQCLVVTHSPHYLRIPGPVSFAYMQQLNPDGAKPRSVIRLLTPQLLEATDEIASDMGFDRGELLSAVSTIVFVEGLADKLFLEEYCGDRLHHAGIALVPIHGAVHAERKGVVDSEIVLGWTSARLAILLDNLVEDEWTKLASDPDFCLQQSRKPAKTELKAMADVILRSTAVGREISPLGIPADDIFDLLDEEILKERFPSFPGHGPARSAWVDATSKHPVNWKAYYRDQYGIEVEPPLFGEIAREMSARGSRPAAAEDLVLQLTALSGAPAA